MPVTRIWDADNGVWQLVGGTVGAEASGAGLYVPLSGGTMTGPLILPGDPAVPNQAATKQYVDDHAGGGGVSLPSGSIIAFGGATAPSGYHLCDGTLLSRTEYAALFAAIGTAYGAGDGSTTFKLPDFRGRFLLAKAASGTGSTLGASGGALGHTHSGPSHTHTGPSHTHDLGNSTSSGATTATSAGAHSHDIPSGTSTGADTHAHTFSDTASDSFTTSSSPNDVVGSGTAKAVADASHSHSGTVTITVSGTTSSDAHSHAIGGISTNNAGVHTHNNPAHAHDLGNSAAAGTGTTGTGGTAETGAANPPFLTANYIIKL